jgi:hypothetical protein
MPRFKGNLSDVQSTFEEMPAGEYTVFLYDINEESGPSDKYWRCEFKIPEGEKFANRSLFTNVSLSPNARWKVKEFFEAFGIDVNKEVDINLAELVGKKCRVRTNQEEFEGEKRLRIKRFLKPKSGKEAATPAAAGGTSEKL